MDEARAVALQSALTFHAAVDDLGLRVGVDADQTIADDQATVLDTAEVFLAWLRGPASIRLTPGPALYQSTGLPSGTPTEGVPVQIHDNEKFDLSLDFKDAKGFDTQDADPATWTVADSTVASVVVSADTHTATVVAGVPGSTTVAVSVTLADGTVLSATEAVDVVPAGAAVVSLVEGPVSLQ